MAAPSPSPTPAPTGARSSRRRRGIAATLAVAAIVAVAIGLGVVGRGTATPSSADTVAETAGRAGLVVPSLALAVAPTTTAPPIPLPVPDPLPTDFRAPTPQVVLGTIEIPKLGVAADLQQGMTLTAIDRGPSQWPGTAEPGHLGNLVVAGHRTTYSQPFADLDQLVAGDTVVFTTAEGSFTYEVRGVMVVPESHIGIAAQSAAHTATLFACHPKGSATHRIVAKLRLLGPDGAPVDDDADLPPVDEGADPQTGTTLFVRDTSAPTLPATDR